MSQTVHVVGARPALRALSLASVETVVGLGLIVVGSLSSWLFASIVGWVLVVLGLVVFVSAWVAARRARVEVILTDTGYRLDGPGGVSTGEWADITRVTRAPGRIVLYGRDGSISELSAPLSSRADLDAIGTDIARRLDADRGYGG